MLELGPNDHLLEIGTGWGGFALHAAQHYGCRVTTTTISQQQYELATQRIADAGLSERIDVLRVDYRDLEGQYDKIVSIEMIEAVGHHYYDAYFGQCSRLLKPDGLMLLQAITIGDWFFEAHTRTVDFIKRYIFPGSCIPSVTAMAQSLSRESDLRIVDLRDIGPHARTLRIWRERFRSDRNRAFSGFQRRIYTHVGILSVLLRSRLCRALYWRCTNSTSQTAKPPARGIRLGSASYRPWKDITLSYSGRACSPLFCL